MSTLYIVIYLVAFALLVGGAFGLMFANIMAIREIQRRPMKHPEAPEPGDELLYVDLEREKLEDLFNK